MKLHGAVVTAFLATASPAAVLASGTTCLLGGAATDAASCATCHGGDHARAHPVDVDYAAAALRRPGLRPAAEVVARGVFLPEGRLQCVSCHDAASPWATKLALPPGAPAVAAVRRDAAGHEARAGWRTENATTVAPGAAVSPAPLCAACHAVD